MVELTIGSRFWYKDKLLEVVKYEDDGPLCGRCEFNGKLKCGKAKCCASERRDGNSVYFKEVDNATKEKPENLTPPNKGPAYVPKKEVTIYIKELKNDQG